MKKNRLASLVALSLLAGFVALSCSNPFTDDPEKTVAVASATSGLLTVTIGDAGSSAARTIVPGASDLPAIATYELTLTCTGATTATGTYTAPALSGTFKYLVPGTWTISVIGKTAAGLIVASGSNTVDITATQTAAVNVTLAYITANVASPGGMSLTLTFPKSVGIDSVDASIDGVAVDPALQITDNGDANSKIVCVASSIATASPLVRISLKKSGVVLLTWVERVWVYKNITTTNSSSLAFESFNTAPPVPVDFIPALLQSDGKVTLSWLNIGTAETYKLERSENSGASYTTIQTLDAGTLSYTDTLPVIEKSYKYRLSATNLFGTSASTPSSADVMVSPAFIVSYDQAALEVDFQGAETASAILNNLTLATSGSAGTTITWAFTTSAIAVDGTVTRPPFSEFPTGNTTGTLTATITNNGVTVTKEFTVTVIRQPGVSFDANTGSGSTTAMPLATGSSVALTSNACTKIGYSFAGWAETPVGTAAYIDKAIYSMTSTVPVILYAKWTVNSYLVSFNSQGGSDAIDQSATYGSPYGALPSSTKIGYTLGGWYDGVGGTGTNITAETAVTITAAQTLYAKWTANTYTVYFSGGTTSSSQITVTYSSTYPELPTTSYYDESRVLDGWWTGSDGSGTLVTAGNPVNITTNIVLYAKWKIVSYVISFNSQDYATPPASLYVPIGNVVPTLPIPGATAFRANYYYGGWYTQTGGGGTRYLAGNTISNNLNLSAAWYIKPESVTATLNNGTAANALDGNDATYWSVSSSPSYGSGSIQIDLPSGLVYKVKIHWATAPTNFSIIYSRYDLYSYDKTLVADGGNQVNGSTVTIDPASPFSCRSLRLTISGSNGTAGASIYEIEVIKNY